MKLSRHHQSSVAHTAHKIYDVYFKLYICRSSTLQTLIYVFYP